MEKDRIIETLHKDISIMKENVYDCERRVDDKARDGERKLQTIDIMNQEQSILKEHLESKTQGIEELTRNNCIMKEKIYDLERIYEDKLKESERKVLASNNRMDFLDKQ